MTTTPVIHHYFHLRDSARPSQSRPLAAVPSIGKLACRSSMLALLIPTVLALQGPPKLSRRAILASTAAVSFGAAPLAAVADATSDLLYGAATSPGASVFIGTYSDPMHPGGTRTITLLGTKLGPYQLAKIVGGGGEGEPASFELPAMVST